MNRINVRIARTSRAAERGWSPMAGSALALLLAFAATLAEAHVGIVNGNFDTGDLTGWTADSLVTPPSVPIGVTVDLVNGSLAADMNFSGTSAGNFAGSLLQDFTVATAGTLSFQFGINLSSTVANGQSPGLQTLDVLLANLTNNSTSPFAQAESPALGPYSINFANITGHRALSPGNYELRFLMNLTTVDGAQTMGRITVDNVTLTPEPASWLLALLGAAAMLARLACHQVRRHR